ncbi:MAG: right-handed parallel beta-helix repeat-containing protein, partial [Methanobrevibacter sp.]|nr:right-handed parallel beta-helix repeat-containing protein [Candidatus Methanovirga aequatorialis]
MYTDADNVLFNISAEPVRISGDSGYVSVKIETNESVNKTFKLKFKNENSTSTIKLDNNMSSTLLSDDFSISSKNNDKVLEITDNTTNESACNLTVLFKNNEIINYNNLILQDSNSITINPSNGTIQGAINNAKPGDTIILEDGEYKEHGINASKANLTIKAAPGANPIVNAEGKNGGVFRIYANSSSSMSPSDYSNISGLTITGGSTNESMQGGGIYTAGTGVSPYTNITNCTITNCTSNGSSGGGGIYTFQPRGVKVTNCTITNNTAIRGDGGGIYSSSESINGVSVTNCNITGNTAIRGDGGGTRGGGGIYTGAVTNCTITNNTASSGEGGGTYGNAVTNCTITGNTANGGGGTYGGTVTNCTITNNIASTNGITTGGGGIHSGTVTNCTIMSNKANGAYGGGAYMSTGTMTNCTITNNTLNYGGNSTTTSTIVGGGGVRVTSSTGAVNNCTITNNTVTGNSLAAAAGGVYVTTGAVNNCTITNNNVTGANPKTGGGGVYFTTGKVMGCTIANNNVNNYGGGVSSTSNGSLNYCRIYNNTATNGGSDANVTQGNIDYNWWGTNNIKTNNMINGPLPNNYYLVQVGADDFNTTVNNSVSRTVPVPLSYSLVLNTTNDSAGVSNLPDFNKTIYLDKSDSSSSRSFFNSRIFRTGMGDPI